MNRALLALLPLTLLPARADRVEFAPAPETTRTKTFTVAATLTLEDAVVVFGDQELDPSALGSPSAEVAIEYVVTVTDVHTEGVAGHPTIERTFDAIDLEVIADGSMFEDGSQSEEATSSLVGETVVFAWNEEAAAYEARSDAIDDDVLEGLRHDMDLGVLLPEGGADLDGAWEITGFGRDLLQPGGDLAVESEDENSGELDEETRAQLLEAAADILEAPLEAAVADTDDDLRLATIRLAMELDASIDLTEILADLIEESFGDEAEVELPNLTNAEVLFEAEPRGTLEWDLDAGLFHSFEMEAVGYVTFELEASVPGLGEASASIEFSVDLRLDAEVDG